MMTTITRRQTLIGAAATVAAAALPAVAVAAVENREILEMTIDGCRHVLNVPWMGDGAPDLIRVGDVLPTKLQDRKTGRQVCLMAIETPEFAS
jgi:hypothetical protein